MPNPKRHTTLKWWEKDTMRNQPLEKATVKQQRSLLLPTMLLPFTACIRGVVPLSSNDPTEASALISSSTPAADCEGDGGILSMRVTIIEVLSSFGLEGESENEHENRSWS